MYSEKTRHYTITVKNSDEMIKKLKLAEQYRLDEKRYQYAKNRLLMEVRTEQERLRKLQEEVE